MTFATPPTATGDEDDTQYSRRGRVLVPTLLVLGVLFVLFLVFSSYYSDWLWFASLDKSSVYTTQLVVKVGMFVGFGLVMTLIIGANMWLAYRNRPLELPTTPQAEVMERYRASLEPLRRPMLFVVSLVFGFLAGLSASGQWPLWLMWRNATPFDRRDPQFGIDAGFWVFTYPFVRFVFGFLFTLLLLSLIITAVVHYLYGGINLQREGQRVTKAARVQLSALAAAIMLLKAGGYWLDRLGVATASDEFIAGYTGVKFRDVNALLPAKTILMFIALIVAAIFIVNMFRSVWNLAMAGLVLLIVAALVIGGIYPAIVQQFQVRPSELVREQDYIARNIEATRWAYGLDDVETMDYAGATEPTPDTIADDLGTIKNVRLLDPNIVSPTYRALQQIRGYYSFPDNLDVDRYNLDGNTRGAVVSVRELNLAGIPDAQRNWANDHVFYTHGYGFVAAYDNTAEANGTPSFFEYDIPPLGDLNVEQPRVYFGESSPLYSIVGAPEGSEPREIDFPDDTSPTGQRNNTYDGAGGVPVGNLLNKAVYATKFGEPNILLSDLVNSESKILYDRTPRQRLAKVAPWLTPDGDPYAAVVDGRIVWIQDAYTRTDQYPNSTRVDLNDATSDSITSQSANVFALPPDQVNYMRNSVKAVIDAYDGTVDLYEWDEQDPILKTWMKSFPGVVLPKSEMSPELLAHVRYPEDLFKVQRLIYSRYHVTDPAAFYNGQDFWIVPNDPTDRESNQFQPPYYLTLQMPGQAAPAFSLTTAFSPASRPTLAAFMAVDSDPGEGYGKFRVLQLPRNTTIPGPAQVQNTFESDPNVASQLSLLRRGGSEVLLGNLLSLPVGDGMLYVEPVYVQAAEGGYPLLRKVLVLFGNRVGFADTLELSLQQVFGVGTALNDAQGGQTPAPQPAPDANLSALEQALSDADRAYQDGLTALRNNDFTAYGDAQRRLEDALRRAREAAGTPAVADASTDAAESAA